MCEHWRLFVFCQPKIIDIDQYLLKLFENILMVRFFKTTVYVHVGVSRLAGRPTCVSQKVSDADDD